MGESGGEYGAPAFTHATRLPLNESYESHESHLTPPATQSPLSRPTDNKQHTTDFGAPKNREKSLDRMGWPLSSVLRLLSAIDLPWFACGELRILKYLSFRSRRWRDLCSNILDG